MAETNLTCDGCGACCLHMGTPPAMYPLYASGDWDGLWCREHPDHDYWVAMPETLRQELRNKYSSEYDEDEGPCMWFDTETRRCRNYDFRPEACREAVQLGDEGCLAFRDQYQELIQIGWRTDGQSKERT